MNYIYNNIPYEIEVIRKDNKNTYLRVKDDKIVVTTNYLVSDTKIKKIVFDNKKFIDRLLSKNENKNRGSSFSLFGYNYDIILGFPKTEIDKTRIYTKDKDSFDKYLKKYITKIYEERLTFWYHLFEENIPVPNLKIRKMSSRWGVCNIKNHNVTLNLELSKYKMDCLDYVIVHELSHFIHPNHSKDFWNLVSKYYPNWKDIRKYLKENG